MVWFKVDDTVAFHPKVVAAGDAAMGLWVRAGSWSAQQLTNGFIPTQILRTLGAKPAQVRALVDAGLWTRVSNGVMFHEWEEMQPTREEVRAARSKNAERQQRFRDRRAEGARNAVTNAVSNAAPARPVPTRPLEESSRGDSPVQNVGAYPPLYPNRCAEHGDWAEPPRCGACADVRKAAGVHPLRLVDPLQKCLVHMLSHTGTCPGCAADEKASNA